MVHKINFCKVDARFLNGLHLLLVMQVTNPVGFGAGSLFDLLLSSESYVRNVQSVK